MNYDSDKGPHTRGYMLIIKLTEQCRSSLDPVLGVDVCVQQDGQHVVGGVTSGRQLTTTFASLVHRTLVSLRRRINVRPSSRPEPDDRHRIVQDSMILLFQYSAVGNKHNNSNIRSRRGPGNAYFVSVRQVSLPDDLRYFAIY